LATTIFQTPIKLVFGEGTVDRVGQEAALLGKRAMVVIGGSSAKKSGLLDKVLSDLKAHGVESIVFEGITPNPRSSTVDEAARVADKNNIDLIIGLGGGSVMDASKAIKLAYSGGRPVFEYYTGQADAKAVKPRAELMLICTMAATGSEFNNGAVLTNWETHEKRFIGVPIYYPAVSIVDPALTLTMPVGQLAKGGVDIFLHVMENYITQQEETPLGDALREAIMKTVVDWLPLSVQNPSDLKARTNLSWASTLACSQFINLGGATGYRPIHLIGHPLSGYLDIAHGDSLAALLPSWLRQSMDVRAARITKAGKNVFGVDKDVVSAVEKWLESVGMLLTLKQLGAREDSFEVLAKAALETSRGLLVKDPIHNSVETIAALYKAAF
jgi:alcohol dehydrogenase YqhD (iron-dependent ADH family)